MTNQQAPEIYALHTVPNKGERPWSGIYAVRADAEHDAKVLRDATGRDWSVVRLVVADTATTPAGPQAETVEEAARDVGKWLNERPNRPLDLRHVAMLTHHARHTAHVQNPAEIEHVAGDVSKNGAELNTSTQQPAPAGATPMPLLVRDAAADFGVTPVQVCLALVELGFGHLSVNMAITPKMAEQLREHFAVTPQPTPAAGVTVEQVEDAIGLQSTAWDTIGAEKIVEAVLRLTNGQAPATQPAVAGEPECTCSAKDMPFGTCCKVRSAFERWYDEQNDGRLQPFDVFKGGWIERHRLSSTPQPTPTAQAASSAVLKAIREANMQLVRTGDNAFMLVPYKVATAQAAESVPAVSDLPPLPDPDLRDVGTKPQDVKDFLNGYATEYARLALAARARKQGANHD